VVRTVIVSWAMTGDMINAVMVLTGQGFRCPRGRPGGVGVGDACAPTAAHRVPPHSTGQAPDRVRREHAGDHTLRWLPRRGV